VELSDQEQYEIGKAEMAEYMARREAFHAEQRALAEVAVTKALRSYRWWGITNILNTIRLWLTARRFAKELQHEKVD
jgi:putative methionine-R-sulfoxide reductase with GAF domain